MTAYSFRKIHSNKLRSNAGRMVANGKNPSAGELVITQMLQKGRIALAAIWTGGGRVTDRERQAGPFQSAHRNTFDSNLRTRPIRDFISEKPARPTASFSNTPF